MTNLRFNWSHLIGTTVTSLILGALVTGFIDKGKMVTANHESILTLQQLTLAIQQQNKGQEDRMNKADDDVKARLNKTEDAIADLRTTTVKLTTILEIMNKEKK